MNSADRRALTVCCKVDRDVVIEEQRAAIHRQQAEIVRLLAENAALRRGDGPIGPVLGRISPCPRVWFGPGTSPSSTISRGCGGCPTTSRTCFYSARRRSVLGP